MASPVTEAAQRIFADLADPQAVNRDADGAWKAPLWRALEEAGLTLAWVPEALGGAGARLAEGFEVLAAAGRYALAAPLAETLLAGWLLARGGLTAPPGMMSLAPVQPGEPIMLEPDGSLRGRARAVPFAPEAAHFAVLAQGATGAHVALVEARACKVDAGKNLAGDPLGNLVFDGTKVLSHARVDLDPTELLLMGCTARAVQSAGALAAMLELALRYARRARRVRAADRPIPGGAAQPRAPRRRSLRRRSPPRRPPPMRSSVPNVSTKRVFLEAAAAKIRCAEAAHEGAAIAHQVFGAIGYTQEHILHRFTLRLLAWRDDFGNESLWAAELGRRVARARRRRTLAAGRRAMNGSAPLRSDPLAAGMRCGCARKCARSRGGGRGRHVRSARTPGRRLSSREFSRKVGAKGWIGMTWPKKYGGRERSFLERYVVTEEFRVANAPVRLHFVADRQSGPVLLKYAPEHDQDRPPAAHLPRRGVLLHRHERARLGLGPVRGEDARRCRRDGGCVINGTKIWTSNAHHADYMLGLFRTSPPTKENRRHGLTQFLVDMKTPGIRINPI